MAAAAIAISVPAPIPARVTSPAPARPSRRAPAAPVPDPIRAPVELPPLPSGVSARVAASVARCADLALQRGLRILWRGVCRVPRFAGAPVWGVASHSRAGVVRMVWLADGRLWCSCPAREAGRAPTCSHAQAVRLALAAGAALPASRPAAYVESPAVGGGLGSAVALAGGAGGSGSGPRCPFCGSEHVYLAHGPIRPGHPAWWRCRSCFEAWPVPVDPDPDPTPPAATAAGPGASEAPAALCPSCGFPVESDELAQLGECLRCLMAAQVCPTTAAAIVEEIHARAEAGAGIAHCPHCMAEADAEQLARYGACPRCIASNPTRAGVRSQVGVRPRPARAEVAARIVRSEEQRQRRYRRPGGRAAAGDPRPELAPGASPLGTAETRERKAESRARRREARETARDIEEGHPHWGQQRPAAGASPLGTTPDPKERKPRAPRAAKKPRAVSADEIEREELPARRDPTISMWR